MDGHTSTKLIKEYEANNNVKKVVVIALTAHVNEFEKINENSGFADLMTKPIIKKVLFQRILAAVNNA
jgi:CheY-like chemotaxis protein